MSLIRKTLLWASTNTWIRERAVKTAFVRKSVVKFMPGETVDDAIKVALALKPAGLNTILTHLGENLRSLEEAEEVRDHYLRVLDLVQASGLDSQVSIKPTQLGYDQDAHLCFKHCLHLLEKCATTNNFLWLDMESFQYVDGTLRLFKRLREHSDRVGVALQAYLYRTAQDIEDLIPLGSTIRLVKGAYLEPASIAFPKKRDVDENYYKLAARVLQAENTKPGALLQVATHDISLQERLLKEIADRQVSSDRYEFAMLYGIQSARQYLLGRRSIRIRCLISYGEHWFPWYMRRLAERPANVWFVARNMFR